MVQVGNVLRARIAFVSFFVLSLLVPLAVEAKEKDKLESSGGVLHSTVKIPMDDGALLLAEVYRPRRVSPVPFVFQWTPYNAAQHAAFGEDLARAGYAVAVINARGKHGSEGDYLPFVDEEKDLLAALNWILEREWSQEAACLFGFSSQSYSAQLLAATGHPAIKTVINISGLTDVEELFFPGGAFRLDTIFPWLQFNYVERPLRSIRLWKRSFRALPLSSSFGWEPEVFQEMAKGSVKTEGIKIPVLHVTGWNDVVYRQTLFLYDQLVRRPVESRPFQKMILGPWMHNHMPGDRTTAGDEDFGPESPMSHADLSALVHRWCDRFLLGKENGIDQEPAIDVFVMGKGANKWRHESEWPPAGMKTRRLYLAPDHSGEEPRVGGLLVHSPPAREAQSSFVFDPNHPVPTEGGVNSHIFEHNAGIKDQSRFNERSDVLVFTSPPLEEDWLFCGPMRVMLHAASSAVDTDFTAKLIEVRADAYERIIEDGIVRARFRVSRKTPQFLTPGKVEPFSIDLGSTALKIPAGSRLRLHISSSNFPKYDRNPNFRVDPFEAEELREATQTIFSSVERPSYVEFGILEK